MKDDFEHRRTDAATAAPVKTTGVNSAFALGRNASETTVVKAKGGRKTASAARTENTTPSVREGSMRHRCLQTLEACGPLTTDGLSDALGITLKQAADLGNQLVTLGLLIKGETEGRKTYAVAKREGGFYGWLERKAKGAAAPADKISSSATAATNGCRTNSGRKTIPVSVPPATQLRCAIFNTGALLIEVNDQKLELCPAHALELKRYLEGTA